MTNETNNKMTEPGQTAPERVGVRRSYLWAALFSAVIAAWIYSGTLANSERKDVATVSETTEVTDTSEVAERKLYRVQVKTFQAKARDAVLTLRGRTEADARVEVQAETAGIVRELPVAKGARVSKGETLCRIDPGARKAALDEAKAKLERAKLDYTAAQTLVTRGHTAKLKVAEYKATRDGAMAALERAQIDLDRTRILAPFDGIVEEQSAKIGDYLSIGRTCAKLVALDPLMIIATVSEREVSKLQVGMLGKAELVTGEYVSGPIHYISPTANAQTRTFRFELKVDNKDGALRDGVTADINIPLKSKPAHLFSPALLVLNDEGEVGVRIVNEENVVQFVPVEILADSPAGVWVAGLPQRATIITVGQDYVRPGQKVDAVETTGIAQQ